MRFDYLLGRNVVVKLESCLWKCAKVFDKDNMLKFFTPKKKTLPKR